MTKMYKLQKDVAGYNGFGLPVSDAMFSATLGASSDTTVNAPSSSAIGAPLNTNNRYLAIINVKPNTEVWFALNATAAVPAGASFASTTSELINGTEYFAIQVQTGDVLHFLTASATTDVSVKFYSLPAS
jgi:hypothetical protein